MTTGARSLLEPAFTAPAAPQDLAAEIARRYTNAEDVGKFQVRWR